MIRLLTPRERFSSIVKFINRVLRDHGFSRRGQCFTYPLPELWRVVRVVRSRWNTADSCDFWIEFGIYVPGVFALIHPEIKEPTCPDASNLTISWTSGWQRPPFLHRSWELTLQDVLPQRDEEIRLDVEEELRYTLSFLDKFTNIFDVIAFLEWLQNHRDEIPGGVHIYPNDVWLPVDLAVLYWRHGNKDACRHYLEAALSREEAGDMFQSKIIALRHRLNC